MLRRNTLCAVVALSGASASVATSVDSTELVATTTGPITSTATQPFEGCHMSCIPNLCTGDATMNGAATHLTYLCPTPSTTSKLRKTVYVTVTVTETVVPTVTSVVAEVPVVESFAEPTTTVTVHKTEALTKTITLQRASPEPAIPAPSSETSEVVITKWSSIASSNIATPIFSLAPISSHDEATTTTDSDTKSYSKTTTVIRTIIVSPVPIPIPSSFPTLTLSANGTTTDGIFYSHSVGNSSVYQTATSGYAIPLYGRGFTPRGSDGEVVMTVTSTVYINVTTRTSHHATPTPTAAYPGAVTQALGKKGGAGGKEVSFLGLVVVAMFAVLVL